MQNVHKKKCHQKIEISSKIEKEHNEKLEEKIRAAEKKYKEGLENFGSAKNGTKMSENKAQKSVLYINYKPGFPKQRLIASLGWFSK